MSKPLELQNIRLNFTPPQLKQLVEDWYSQKDTFPDVHDVVIGYVDLKQHSVPFQIVLKLINHLDVFFHIGLQHESKPLSYARVIEFRNVQLQIEGWSPCCSRA